MKNLLVTAVFATALFISPKLTAQDFSGLDTSPADIAAYPASHQNSDKRIRVIYSRPQLKGRELASLAPVGKVWRTGANESAEVTLYTKATVGGEELAAGTYSLFTIPGEEAWTVIFNKNLNQWGSYFYDEAGDVVRVQADVSQGDSSLEAFSIAFKEVEEGVHMVMGWGTTRVALPMKFSD